MVVLGGEEAVVFNGEYESMDWGAAISSKGTISKV
jgi:hypothetical protein